MGHKQAKQMKKSNAKQAKKEQYREGEIPHLKSSSVMVFIAGLITTYTIFPDSWSALIVYAVVMGAALGYYIWSHDKKLKE